MNSMKTTKTIITLLIITLVLPSLLIPAVSRAQATIDPNFDPNNIVSDAALLDYNSMGLADIQNFLQKKGSYLANYYATDTNGISRSAAEIIYNASHNNYNCDNVTLSDTPTEAEKQAKCQHITTINPKFLLILLQKEQGLIEDPNPAQGDLDWATGYGCPDNWVCNPYYKGFGKQVNSASLQFLAYINEQDHYNFKMGQTYIVNNTPTPYCTASNQTMAVTPVNKATAALYNYTPHVFNGNYNVFLLWQRYFPKVVKLYPDGSLLQAPGSPDVWLISGGKRRQFLTYAAFASRYNDEQIVKVTADDLSNYYVGDPIKFSNYALVQTPDKKIYLLVDSEKRPFSSLTVFKKIGFNPAEIDPATLDDLSIFTLGKAITATSTNVTGALIQDSKTGGVYYVENGTKAPIVDKILLTLRFPGKKIVKATTKTLNTYTTVAPILFPDGTLLASDSFPTVYLISNGQKRAFADGTVFSRLGYSAKNVITVSSKFLYNYPNGEVIQ